MLLDIQHLTTSFDTPEGEVCAVNDVSLQIDPGQCLGVVGESGSGKTQVFMSMMGLSISKAVRFLVWRLPSSTNCAGLSCR